MSTNNRLIIKITHDNLPQIKDRYPFIYLEHGRVEIDDSSVKWIGSRNFVVRLPVATIGTILLGPGTSVTHEAIKVLSAANTTVCWVGEDSLLFYAISQSPTSDTRKIRTQMNLASSSHKRLEVARRMFAFRFPETDISDMSLNELMGMEGVRVRALYEQKAQEYGVGWSGRRYVPGQFEMSDFTNKILSAANTALYSLILSVIVSMGYSPHLGFIHTGSPLPFVYDIADLYKADLCVDFAFHMTSCCEGEYDRREILDSFRGRVSDYSLFERVPTDIKKILGENQ